MPALTCPLIPLDAVRVGEVTIVPDATRPVAAIVAADSTVGWVAWPDAPMPHRAIGEAPMAHLDRSVARLHGGGR